MSQFCAPQPSSTWFPLPPGMSVPPVAPAVTTNATPRPADSVELPTDFDLGNPDLCRLFENLLPTNVAAIYPAHVAQASVLPPYVERVPGLGRVRARLLVAASYDYPLSETMAATVARVRPGLRYVGTTLEAGTGVVMLQGQDADLVFTRTLEAGTGVVVVSGQAAELLGALDPGVVMVQGQTAELSQGRVLEPSAGVLLVDGQAAELVALRGLLEADTGVVVMGGQAAELAQERVLEPDPGVVMMLGMALDGVDDYASLRRLLLHYDGANGSTQIIDSSASARTISVRAGVELSTAVVQFGTASVRLPGTGGIIASGVGGTSSILIFDAITLTGAFTIETWARADDITQDQALIGGASGNRQIFRMNPDNEFGAILCFADGQYFRTAPSSSGTFNGTAMSGLVSNQFFHIAWTRDTSNLNRLFVNGTQVAEETRSGDVIMDCIGAGFTREYNLWRGYVDETRITDGRAEYVANFTPSGPFP